jgi:hypothetical protein
VPVHLDHGNQGMSMSKNKRVSCISEQLSTGFRVWKVYVPYVTAGFCFLISKFHETSERTQAAFSIYALSVDDLAYCTNIFGRLISKIEQLRLHHM